MTFLFFSWWLLSVRTREMFSASCFLFFPFFLFIWCHSPFSFFLTISPQRTIFMSFVFCIAHLMAFFTANRLNTKKNWKIFRGIRWVVCLICRRQLKGWNEGYRGILLQKVSKVKRIKRNSMNWLHGWMKMRPTAKFMGKFFGYMSWLLFFLPILSRIKRKRGHPSINE